MEIDTVSAQLRELAHNLRRRNPIPHTVAKRIPSLIPHRPKPKRKLIALLRSISSISISWIMLNLGAFAGSPANSCRFRFWPGVL